MRSSTSKWISSMKFILISFGIVSLAMAIKFSAPFIVHFVFIQLPMIWSIILPWTKPLYLFIILNGIIITIAATSRFHQAISSPPIPSKRLVSVNTPPPSDFASFLVQPEFIAVDEPLPLLEYESVNRTAEVKAVLVNGTTVHIDQSEEETEANIEIDGEDKFIISSSTYTQPHTIITPDVQSEFLPPVMDKALVPSTFRHQKTIRANSKDARVSRVRRPKRQETLDSIWNIITEGRHLPPRKHLKRQLHGHHATTSSPEQVPESNTFKNYSTNYESPFEAPLKLSSSTKISRESSPSQDELNRRIEAFIKKTNEEMRLQRQESLDQYMDMINRGA